MGSIEVGVAARNLWIMWAIHACWVLLKCMNGYWFIFGILYYDPHQIPLASFQECWPISIIYRLLNATPEHVQHQFESPRINITKATPTSPPSFSASSLHTIPLVVPANLNFISTLQLKKATVLAESSFLFFVFKPIDALQEAPTLSQVGASPLLLFTIYFVFANLGSVWSKLFIRHLGTYLTLREINVWI